MPLTPSYSISGKVNWSLDGANSGGSIQAVVPEGSTIVAAFLYGSTYGGSVTAAQLGGMAVTGFTSLGSTGQLRAFRADVTGIVSTLLGDGDAATFNLPVSLTTGSGLNGFALAIVYSNPLEQARTITFLDGASATTGDQFTINYGAPLDTAAPGFEATMSLGIGFSAQPSGQISTIDVNGTRLTSSAGGQDDSNSLVTIGGIGDSITNPSASANDSGGFRTDDELYDLRPFLVPGATSTTIATRNPTNDDLIFFAGINVTAVASVVIPGGNTAPVANDDSATTAEDSSILVNVLANDTDAESNTLTISSASVTTGSGTATIESGQVRYDPGSAYQSLAQGQQATAVVTYAISDGEGGNDSASLTVTINGVDDAPDLDTSITQVTYTENGTLTVDTALSLTDVDGGNLSGAVVAIASGYVNGQDSLGFTPMFGITGAFNAATGQLTLSGTATAAQYQAALRSVTYANNSDAPSTGDRQIEFSANSASALFYSGSGHFYQFVSAAPSANLTWNQANAAASASRLFGLQGYLATITSAGEQAFVQSRLQGAGWMGATDVAAEGDWRWVTGPEGLANGGTGTPFWSGGANGSAVGGAYVNWSPAEPNNFANEDYGHFYAGGPWNDFPLSKAGEIAGYVVEYGGMPGDPLVDLTGSVTIKIQAVNDPVLIVAGATVAAGAVAELGDGSVGEGTAAASASGAIAFSDLDDSNAHSAVVAAQGANYLGTFALGAVNQATNQVGWSFSVSDGALEWLAAGQQIVQNYKVTISDGGGASVDQNVSVTLTGSNDAPVITPNFADFDRTGYVNITGPAAFTGTGAFSYEVSFRTTATGIFESLVSVGFYLTNKAAEIAIGPDGVVYYTINNVFVIGGGFAADGNWHRATSTYDGAGHHAFYVDGVLAGTRTAVGVNLTGGVALIGAGHTSVVNRFDGEIAEAHLWNRALSAAEALDVATPAASDSGLIGSYRFSGDATNSATGLPDGVIGGGVRFGLAGSSGSIAELADNAAGEGSATASVGGPIAFADLDLADTHSASFTPQGANYLGTFALGAVDQQADELSWSFSVADGALDHLASGQVVTQTYAVAVSDNHGGSAVQPITVTITGANDAPQIVAGGLPGIDIISGAPATFVYPVGERDTAYYAQTFTATSAVLTGIAVPLDWIGGDGSADLRLLITTVRFDGGGGFHPDQVLFESNAIVVPVDADEGFTIYSVNLGGLALTSGQQYAIVLDGKALADGITGLASWQEGTDYAGGTFYYLNAGGSGASRPADFSAGWTLYNSSFDGAFRLSTGSTTTGAVTEAGSLDDGTPVAGTAVATGSVIATDVDQGDVLTWSGSAAGSYGSFAINAQGSWTYTLDNARPGTAALAEGQVVTETFTVTVTDLAGATDTETVTITVNGTNDAPVISDNGSAVRSLFEPGFDGNGAGRGSFQTVGQFFASDVDAGATQAWSVVGGGDSQFGALAINQNGVWTYTLDGVAADSLALGQLAVETFIVRVMDGQGAFDDREVRIEITGSNDTPTMVDATGQNIVGEATDGSAQENVVVHAASGQVLFADADLGDSHGASFAPTAAGYLGTFAIGQVDAAGKSVGWTFSVPDAALDGLASGEIVAQTYNLIVADANGLSVTTPVTVYLYGSNDAALLSSANVVLAQSNVPVSASGDLTISDVDGPELFQAQTGTVGDYGTFTIDANGQWSYQAASANLGLAPGESLTDLFTVYAADGTPTSVSVTITGSADGGVARPDLFVTDEASAIGSGLSLFADNGYGADSDPDNALKIVSVAGGPVGQVNQLGSGSLLRVNADGTFSYDPNDAFNTLNHVAGSANQQAYDTFSYTLSDGSSTVVTIRVNGLNSPEDIILGQPASGEYLNNVIFGTSGNDRFMLQPGGTRGAYGHEGNDGFYFGAVLGSQYLVDGGAGTDTLAVQGNYPGLVLGEEMTDVEVLLVLSGSDARFGDNAGASYHYNIATVDANVAAGKILTVQADGLKPGEDFVFDGSAETDGAFRIFAGQGDDALTGGAGNDGFFFGADGNLTGADRIVGGAGTDSLALRGNYVGADAVVLEDASLSGIEVIVLLSGLSNEFGGTIVPTGFDYDLTLANGNVAAGQRLDIIATNLGGDESVRLDGRAELDGTLRILSGAGDDQLFGGAQADTLSGGLGADTIDGGAGADYYLYRSALESTAAARDTLTLSAGDRIDLSAIDANAGTAANDAFSFIGGASFGGVAGELRASQQGGQWIVEGDVNGDGLADLVIAVNGLTPLTVADFVL